MLLSLLGGTAGPTSQGRLCCWGLHSFWLHPPARPAAHSPQHSTSALRGGCRCGGIRRAKLCSPPSPAELWASPSIYFSISRNGTTPLPKDAPFTLPSKGRAQRSSFTSQTPTAAGAAAKPPLKEKPPAQCKSPCSCCASCYAPSLPCPIITLWNCTAAGTRAPSPAPQGSAQPHTAGVNGAAGSVTPEVQLPLHGGVGFWRGTSICPGFCQSNLLISGQEPKGGSGTPRARAVWSVRADAEWAEPWGGRMAVPRHSPRDEWFPGASRGCRHLVRGLLRAAHCPFPFPHCGWEKTPSLSAPGCRGLELCGRDE